MQAASIRPPLRFGATLSFCDFNPNKALDKRLQQQALDAFEKIKPDLEAVENQNQRTFQLSVSAYPGRMYTFSIRLSDKDSPSLHKTINYLYSYQAEQINGVFKDLSAHFLDNLRVYTCYREGKKVQYYFVPPPAPQKREPPKPQTFLNAIAEIAGFGLDLIWAMLTDKGTNPNDKDDR